MSVVTRTFEDQVVSAFNGYDGFKVTKEGSTNYYEKSGVKLPFHQKTIGWRGAFELTLERPLYGYNYEGIARVTGSVNIDQQRYRKKFAEQANYRINKVLAERISAPSLEKSKKSSEKSFNQWQKENAKLLEHEAVAEVKPEEKYKREIQTCIGTNKLITELKAYADDEIPNPPTLTQLFGVIVQSGIKVYSVDNNDVKVIGSDEETTEFLKLLNSPLEWSN